MIFLAILALLSLLIMVHELGHLITARLAGVKVLEFGLGFPPRLLSFRWGETVYSLNLLFFGGFVRLLGEDSLQGPGSLWSKPLPVRLAVLVAGSGMNLLLPLLLFSAAFMVPRQMVVGEVVIQEVSPGSPAEVAGLLPGDRVVRVGDQEVRHQVDLILQVQVNLGREIELELEREGGRRMVSLTPRLQPPPGEGALGVMVGLANPRQITISSPPWQAFPQGARMTVEVFSLLRQEVGAWFSGRGSPQVGGPVAIVQIAGEAARAGPGPLLAFTAFISINLALINLLPIPGLDGGRLFFVALEGVRGGKRIAPHRERLIHIIGFLFLLAFILFISYYDLSRLLRGEQMVP